jgi:tetratricopeptide (TPR) repeat protein
LPLICLLAGLGFNAILSEFHLSKWKNIFVFFLLAFLSLGLDIYHYDGPGQLNDWDYWISNKRHFESVDFSRAYPILETAYKNGKPLSLLINLNNNNNYDQTLNVVTSPFENAAGSGTLNHSGQKAALLINSNYEPFLKKEFPNSDWKWLSPDLPNDYGGFTLGLIAVDSGNEKIVERWKKADDAFKRNNWIFMESISDPADKGLKDLYAQYPVFHGDRFLESVFWDKVAFYEEYRADIPAAIAALENGEKDGFPSAQLFEETGELFGYLGKKEEAGEYFEKAIDCPVNRTTAAENIKNLKLING